MLTWRLQRVHQHQIRALPGVAYFRHYAGTSLALHTISLLSPLALTIIDAAQYVKIAIHNPIIVVRVPCYKDLCCLRMLL